MYNHQHHHRDVVRGVIAGTLCVAASAPAATLRAYRLRGMAALRSS